MPAFLQTKASKKFKKISTAGAETRSQFSRNHQRDTVTARFRTWIGKRVMPQWRVVYLPCDDDLPALARNLGLT